VKLALSKAWNRYRLRNASLIFAAMLAVVFYAVVWWLVG
jgi:hypothetical protein